jgi:hypothetical protein
MKKCIFKEEKTNGRTLLTRCYLSYYKLLKSIVNCSASGKKKGGDHHVVKALEAYAVLPS